MIRAVDGPGSYTNVSVTTTAAELKTGASAQLERKVLIIQPKANSIYLGFDNSVTTSNGIEVKKDQTFILEVGPKITVYAIASSGSIDTRIMELS